jgi:glycosyltransferase involved in cell wall biosynthesis
MSLGINLFMNVYVLQLSPIQQDSYKGFYKNGYYFESYNSMEDLLKVLNKMKKRNPGITIFIPMQASNNIFKKIESPKIQIQHGIYWDGIPNKFSNVILRKLYYYWRLYKNNKAARLNKQMSICADKIVTVDTNYQNWLRTKYPQLDLENKLEYIPNFADLAPKEKILCKLKTKKDFKIILFPRRFCYIRGVTVWEEIINSLSLDNVEFRFVGSGEKEQYLRMNLANRPNVKIYEKKHAEMQNEYLEADICVIPSLYSEGTSFSCVEAMGAGCALIVTNIGGLGNLVIPGYNGLITQPNKKSLCDALLFLLKNDNLIKKMGWNNYRIVAESLNRESWEKRFGKILEQLWFNFKDKL